MVLAQMELFICLPAVAHTLPVHCCGQLAVVRGPTSPLLGWESASCLEGCLEGPSSCSSSSLTAAADEGSSYKHHGHGPLSGGLGQGSLDV